MWRPANDGRLRRGAIALCALAALLVLSFGAYGHEHHDQHTEQCADCHLPVATPAPAGPALLGVEEISSTSAALEQAGYAQRVCHDADPIRGPPSLLS